MIWFIKHEKLKKRKIMFWYLLCLIQLWNLGNWWKFQRVTTFLQNLYPIHFDESQDFWVRNRKVLYWNKKHTWSSNASCSIWKKPVGLISFSSINFHLKFWWSFDPTFWWHFVWKMWVPSLASFRDDDISCFADGSIPKKGQSAKLMYF